MKKKNLIGERFNKLLVIKEVSERSNKHIKWICLCDCGNKTITSSNKLLTERTKSCGCFKIKAFVDRSLKHGYSSTRFYRIWKGMNSRCNNKNRNIYHYYGGRNIKIIWKSFQEFKEDMYTPYIRHVALFGEKETTIDRIDSDGHYCKENCRWATNKEQFYNRRNLLRSEEELKII